MKFLFGLATLFILFSCFTEEPDIQLTLSSKIKNGKMKLAEFLKIDKLETNDPAVRFYSCNIFINPPKNSRAPSFELTVKNPILSNTADYKIVREHASLGSTVSFTDIEVLLPSGATKKIKPIVIELQ